MAQYRLQDQQKELRESLQTQKYLEADLKQKIAEITEYQKQMVTKNTQINNQNEKIQSMNRELEIKVT